MKQGDKFIHKYWLDQNLSQLKCVVTAIRNGVVYWKGENHKKSRMYFAIEDIDKYVKEFINDH